MSSAENMSSSVDNGEETVSEIISGVDNGEETSSSVENISNIDSDEETAPRVGNVEETASSVRNGELTALRVRNGEETMWCSHCGGMTPTRHEGRNNAVRSCDLCGKILADETGTAEEYRQRFTEYLRVQNSDSTEEDNSPLENKSATTKDYRFN